MTTTPEPPTDFATVVDWLEGRTDPQGSAELERRLAAGDPVVTAAVDWWRRFRAAAALPTEPVPAELHRRLVGMLDPLSVTSSPRPGLLERAMRSARAAMTFDSLASPGLAMARSSADASRQLVFSAPGFDLALDLSSPDPAGVVTTASLLPYDEGVAADDVLVGVWGATGLVRETRSDALGRLTLGRLPPEVLLLEVEETGAWPVVDVELDLRP